MLDEENTFSSVETVVAALIYLAAHHARTGCPGIATCIERHLDCLAEHPQAGPIIREICASVRGLWSRNVCIARPVAH